MQTKNVVEQMTWSDLDTLSTKMLGGAFSSNKGADFQAVLTELIKIAEPDAPNVPMPDKGKWSKQGWLYDEMGRWSIAWKLHDAQYYGVPQRRKRICVLADFCGLTAPTILLEPKLERTSERGEPISLVGSVGAECRREVQPISESVSGHTEQSIEEGQGTPGSAEDGIGESNEEILDGWHDGAWYDSGK